MDTIESKRKFKDIDDSEERNKNNYAESKKKKTWTDKGKKRNKSIPDDPK